MCACRWISQTCRGWFVIDPGQQILPIKLTVCYKRRKASGLQLNSVPLQWQSHGFHLVISTQASSGYDPHTECRRSSHPQVCAELVLCGRNLVIVLYTICKRAKPISPVLVKESGRTWTKRTRTWSYFDAPSRNSEFNHFSANSYEQFEVCSSDAELWQEITNAMWSTLSLPDQRAYQAELDKLGSLPVRREVLAEKFSTEH